MTRWGDRLKEENIIKNESVIEAMNKIKREDFLPEKLKRFSYLDEPIEIMNGQTQSAPHMNGIFLEVLNIRKDDIILEIGTGTGYLTAMLAFLGKKVISVEIIKELALTANKNIKKYNLKNVEIINANINRICFKSKFSAIISAASFPSTPSFLYEKLTDDGRFVYPLGSYLPQSLIIFRNGKEEKLGTVAFVQIIN